MTKTTYEGDHSAEGLRIAIVASRFNDTISEGLLEGAVDCLERHNCQETIIVRVPGAFEIPAAAARVLKTGTLDALITIGALIRGDTPHFEFISTHVTGEVMRLSIVSGIPIAFGIITCNTMEQARERSGKTGNKGWEAALAAIEMANLYRKIGNWGEGG